MWTWAREAAPRGVSSKLTNKSWICQEWREDRAIKMTQFSERGRARPIDFLLYQLYANPMPCAGSLLPWRFTAGIRRERERKHMRRGVHIRMHGCPEHLHSRPKKCCPERSELRTICSFSYATLHPRAVMQGHEIKS